MSHRFPVRLIALISTMFLFVTQFGFPGGLVEAPKAQASEDEGLPVGAQELVERRTQRSKSFLNADGSYTARLFTGPIHFLATDGTWQEIDTRVVPSEKSGFAWRNTAGDFAVHFAANAATHDMVHVADSTSSISFGVEAANTQSVALVQGSSVIYPEVRPGVDLVYEVRNGEVKEFIILKQAPDGPIEFDFPLSLDNLTAQEVGSGALNLVKGSGDLGFRISDLWMIDSSSSPEADEPAFSENVMSSLVGSVEDQTLRVTPDYDWLTAPERVYPVIIDPTTTKTTNDDTYVQSNIFNTDTSGENEMKSGTYDGGTTKARTLMKFADVQNQPPAGASITGANLFVYEHHSWSCTPRDVSVHRITDPWDGNSVRWGNQPGVASAATTVSAAKGFSSSCVAGWVTFGSLGTMVQYWKANNNNYGIEIRSPNETNSDWWKKWRPLGSGNAPYLEVYYTEPDTTPPPAPSTDSSTHPSTSSWYANDDPCFSFSSSDASGIEGYSYHVDQTSSVKPDNIRDTTGSSVCLTNAATSDGDWYFHVRAKDNAGNWGTEWTDRRFRVDMTAPPAPSVSSSTHSSDTCSTNNDPSFSFSASDISGITGYSYVLDNSSGTIPDTTSEGTATTKSYTDVADGDWWFHVRAQNGAGLWGSTARFKIKIDAVPPAAPSVSSSSHPNTSNWYASRDPSFGWSLTDFFTINGYSHILDQNSSTTPDTTSEGTATSTSHSALADGEHYFHIRGRDGCSIWGNSAHFRVRIDATSPSAPSVSSSSHPSETTWYSNSSPSFSFSTTDLSGIDGYSYVRDQSLGTTPDTTSEGTSTTASYSGLADGVHHFHVRARNGSGLWSDPAHRQVQIDTTKPSVPNITSSTHPDETLTYSNNDPSLSWTADDYLSGVSGYSFVLDQASNTTPDTTSEGSGAFKSYSDLADGVWWFHVRTKDGAGNWGDPDHFKVSIDIPAPYVTPTLTGPSGQIDPDGEAVVKDGDLLTFSGPITQGVLGPADTAAAITRCDLVVRNDAGTEVNRIAVALTTCKNNSGNLTGSASPASLGVARGTVELEVVAERTQGGVTKSSGTRVSSELRIDNDVPVIEEAVMGCPTSALPLFCQDDTSIMVLLSEPVRGDFGLGDFAVDGNAVIGVYSSCSAASFCGEVTLQVGLPMDEQDLGNVSFAHLTTANHERPHDGLGHQLADQAAILVPESPDDGLLEDGEPLAPLSDADDLTPVVDVARSPENELLVVTTNVRQSGAAERNGYINDCSQTKAEGDCNAAARERAYARRIKVLAERALGTEDIDGMAHAPDIILLQETRCRDAKNIAGYLNGKITIDNAGPDYQVAKCRLQTTVRERPLIKNDTAIMYSKATVKVGDGDQGGAVQTGYKENDRPAKCDDKNSAEYLVDLDLDGVPDCKVLKKRHFMLSFIERGTSFTTAVMSLHFVRNAHLADGTTMKMDWSNKVAAALENRYPNVDSYAIAGDFNIQRCLPGQATSDTPEPQGCGEHLWYDALKTRGYIDSVYSAHGDPTRLHTEDELTAQYRDGCLEESPDGTCPEEQRNSRSLRIDFVWTKSEAAPRASSYDLTCGFKPPRGPVPHCDEWLNVDRYTDHRLVWSFVSTQEQILPIPAPTVTPEPSISPLPVPTDPEPSLPSRTVEVQTSAVAARALFSPGWYHFDWSCEAIAHGSVALATRILSCVAVDVGSTSGASLGNRVEVSGHAEDSIPFEEIATTICWVAEADFVDGTTASSSGCHPWTE